MRGSGSEAKALCPPRSRIENQELMRGAKRDAYPSEFPGVTSSRMIVDNPYLPVDRGFFNKIRSLACDPKGGLWVTATAWLKPNGSPYATGVWRVAQDGRITALAAKPWALESTSRYPACNAPFQKSGVAAADLTRLTPASDGSMLAISADGRTACPKNDPENHLVFDHFARDQKSGELIVAGTHLWRGPPTGDNFFSSVWRVSPDGATKRVYAAKAFGSGPTSGLGTLGGLALDRAGAIWIAQNLYGGTDEGTRIVRIEAGGRAVRVAGSPLPVNVDHADGLAQAALFSNDMTSMCFDPEDTLFIHVRNMIRKMIRAGRVTSWAY